jgi:hypothetical protein
LTSEGNVDQSNGGAAAAAALFTAVTQNLSQKLTSDGNVGSSNAAALLHALHLGPTKEITMCYIHLIPHGPFGIGQAAS